MMCPVLGVPFVNQSKLIKTFTMVHRSESKMVIDVENFTPDTPYGTIFTNKELWIIIGSEKDPNH